MIASGGAPRRRHAGPALFTRGAGPLVTNWDDLDVHDMLRLKMLLEDAPGHVMDEKEALRRLGNPRWRPRH